MKPLLSLWRGEIEPPRSHHVGWLAIVAAEVCEDGGITLGELKGPSRSQRIAWPRQAFYYRALQETALSAPTIAHWCGGRHHTTVLDGADRHAERNNLPYARNRGMRDDAQIGRTNPFRRSAGG